VVRRVLARGLILVAVAVITIGIMALLLEFADESGWIPHRRVATVLMVRNWRAGEWRWCRLTTDIQTPVLVCGGEDAQERMSVEFRGSLHATEWHCRREMKLLACSTK
jgi:hypothetical protein